MSRLMQINKPRDANDMTNSPTCRQRLLRSAIAAVVFFGMAVAAQAQEKPRDVKTADDQLQEVVVTGSRIARPDFDRLEPNE